MKWEKMGKNRFWGKVSSSIGEYVNVEILMNYVSGKIKYSFSYRSPNIRRNVRIIDISIEVDSV